MARKLRPTPEFEHTPSPALQPLLSTRLNQPALLTSVLGAYFAELGVSASYQVSFWYPIHGQPDITAFEYDHGVASRRWEYNGRVSETAVRTREVAVGQHAGFFDFFVPVVVGRQVVGLLIAGPVARGRPTSSDVLGRWHAITGMQGRMSDPRFAHYLEVTLSTLTLDGRAFESMRKLLMCAARLVVEHDPPRALASEMDRLQKRLLRLRDPERMWAVAQALCAERTAAGMRTHSGGQLQAMGLHAFPGYTIVALFTPRAPKRDVIQEAIVRDRYQRECTRLARELGGVISGRVGDQGVFFLVHHPGRGVTRRLSEIVERANTLARRFGLELHAGFSADSGPLPAQYQAAFRGAEQALASGADIVRTAPPGKQASSELHALRVALSMSLDPPEALGARFERFIEGVLAHSGYRLDAARGRLEAGFENLADALLSKGFLDARSFDELCGSIERASRDAGTILDLITVYRSAVRDLELAVRSPVQGHTERSLKRALDVMHERMGEPLTISEVARVAGFARDYFSRVFKKSQGATFSRYLQNLRIERAKRMLATTTLSVEQIQRLSGLGNRAYFQRRFKQTVGITPLEYRATQR